MEIYTVHEAHACLGNLIKTLCDKIVLFFKRIQNFICALLFFVYFWAVHKSVLTGKGSSRSRFAYIYHTICQLTLERPKSTRGPSINSRPNLRLCWKFSTPHLYSITNMMSKFALWNLILMNTIINENI